MKVSEKVTCPVQMCLLQEVVQMCRPGISTVFTYAAKKSPMLDECFGLVCRNGDFQLNKGHFVIYFTDGAHC